jgi:hypothetical protein
MKFLKAVLFIATTSPKFAGHPLSKENDYISFAVINH